MRAAPLAPTSFLLLSAVCLLAACGDDPVPTGSDDQLSDDRLFIPVPEVRRAVELQNSTGDARAARREISAGLNFSRVLLARGDSPARRVTDLPWEWETEGCRWIRWIEVEECARLVSA